MILEIKDINEVVEHNLSRALYELKERPVEIKVLGHNEVIDLEGFKGLLIEALKAEYIPKAFWNYKDGDLNLKDFMEGELLEADNPELLDTIYEDIAVRIVRKLTRGKKINTNRIIEKVLDKYDNELTNYKAY